MTPSNVTTATTRDVIQHIQLILNRNRLRSATKILLKNVTLNMKIKLSMKALKFVMKDLSEIAKEKKDQLFAKPSMKQNAKRLTIFMRLKRMYLNVRHK